MQQTATYQLRICKCNVCGFTLFGFRLWEFTSHENEDPTMKAPGICSGRFPCQHKLTASIRVKKPGPFVSYLHWLQLYLLVVFLTDQASCNQSSTSLLPKTAQTSVYYFLDVTVEVTGQTKNESEIITSLEQVFQNDLENYIFPNSTTANATELRSQSTTTQSTKAQSPTTTKTTTTTAATTTQSPTTTITTAATTTQSLTTTVAPTVTITQSNSTTTARANTNTAPTSIQSQATTATTLQRQRATTIAATSTQSQATTGTLDTTFQSQMTTQAETSTTTHYGTTSTLFLSKNTTTSPPSMATTLRGGGPNGKTNNPNPNSNHSNRRRREIRGNVTENSGITNNTTGLFQGIEVSCTQKNAIRHTNCGVTLRLNQTIPPCAILQLLCAASKNSSGISVVGRRVDRLSPLQNECNSNPESADSCIYSGLTNQSCDDSGPVYVAQSNLTNCGADNNTCSCTAYCNRSDAYYTFNITVQDPMMNYSSLISKIKQPPSCIPSANDSCPLSINAEYKNASLTCGSTSTNLQNCSVILQFASHVPICSVAAVVTNLFRDEDQISYDGVVVRAAICGNLGVNDNPLQSPFTWVKTDLKPANFCEEIQASNTLTCQNGKNVVVLLAQSCNPTGVSTTARPNVTTIQPNSTAVPVNATSVPLNRTTTQQNTTQSTDPITAANVTASSKENTVVTTTQIPTTTLSAESEADALLEWIRSKSNLNSSEVDQLLSQLEILLSGPNVSLALGNTSIQIISVLLDGFPEILANFSNRVIGIVDTVPLKLVLDGAPETLLSPAVAVSVKPTDGANFQETFFSISDPSDVQVRGDPRLRRSLRIDSSIPQGSIRLPESLTQNLSSEEQQQASRVQFNFYQNDTVFQDPALGQRILISGILGASVANLSITGLQDDVIIQLRHTNSVQPNYEAKCVFWDFALNDGSGGWNSTGCKVLNSTDNDTICSCNHLTSFAILLDLSREPITSRIQATILTFITYIGCGISAIFLSITLLTYLIFGKLRKDIPSKILIQLCLALLLLNLVFLVDAWLALYPNAVGLCISTAWFLHYFLLVAFTWMGLEAVHMYLALVKVFNSHISHYMLRFSAVGWGLPMLVVIIVIAIDKDNYGLISYGRFDDGTTDEFCWLKNDIAFYVAVVAYFCIIFLFNLVMFVIVLVQLYRIRRQNPHNNQHRSTLQDVRSVTGITILLGLTWGFAFFAWGPVNLAFMYLFAIFNSLQGFFIFVFHCAVKENVRRQWRTYLCCGRLRLAENSEWSRTATQKNRKKSSVTNQTSLHSSNGNSSSNSSSFLVNNTSQQSNGIGNPLGDRVITADENPSRDVVFNELNSTRHRNRQAP